jgi:hypothetical protein
MDKPASVTCTKKTINLLPTAQDVERARNVFVTRFIARFVQKHRKYVELLEEHGASLPEAFSTCSVNFSAPFEDEVAMIVSEKKRKINSVCRMKGVYSIKRLFKQIYHIVRRARASRIECKLLDISTHDIMESLNDIGSELSIAYEYQIVLLISEQEVRQLADFAVSCTMNYLKQSDSTFNRCSILEAITDTPPRKSLSRAEKVSTRITKTDIVKGSRPQKWRLSEIFKQPGLRIPIADGSGYLFYGCFTPYGSLCRPDKYGFRGPIHVWDDKSSSFVLLYNDQVSVSFAHRREIERNTSDIHQNYEPSMLCVHLEAQQHTVTSLTSDCSNTLNETSNDMLMTKMKLTNEEHVNSEETNTLADINDVILTQKENTNITTIDVGESMPTQPRNSDIVNANILFRAGSISNGNDNKLTKGDNSSNFPETSVTTPHCTVTATKSDIENSNIPETAEESVKIADISFSVSNTILCN